MAGWGEILAVRKSLRDCNNEGLVGTVRSDSSFMISTMSIPRGEYYRKLEPLKYLLAEAGSLLSEKNAKRVSSFVNYLQTGRWIKAHGFSTSNRVWERVELLQQVAAKVGEQRALYLDFGVAHGRSIRVWSSLLKHPDSRLHGFDTFEGLPPGGGSDWEAGLFSQGGKPPEIADPRVSFFKGLFEETLPHYKPPPHDVLIVSIDCDLYSSTIVVLNALAPYLKPGSYIYFDEFSDYHHELRAFDEFLTRTGRKCTMVGATKSYAQVVFQFA